MKGRTLLLVTGGLMAVFTAALWYFQVYAFYRDLPQEPVVVAGTSFDATTWQGTDGTSSPLKRRVCLTVAADAAVQMAAGLTSPDTAEPLLAPRWFDCFDAKKISRDIEAGAAKAGLIASDVHVGIDEYLAVYPDGRAYIWRQLSPEFAD